MKIIAIIISIMSILGFGSNDTSKVLDMGIYPKTAMVFEVEDGIVSCIDHNGGCWEFEEDGWRVGELCSMIMCDSGTEEITDDIIVSTEHAGYSHDYVRRYYRLTRKGGM